MAALGTIRKRGALLIGIIGLGLFGFIAGDVFRSCETQTNEARMQVGEIAGEKISVQEFQSLIEEMTEVYKMQGMENMNEQQTNQLRDQVWNQCVSNVLLNNEVEDLGLTVTDEELQNVIKEGTHQMLLSFTPFVNPQTGRFDANSLQQFISSYKTMNFAEQPQVAEQYEMIYKYWKFIEKNLRQNILATKYNALLGNCILSNPIAAKTAFDSKNIDADILLASVPYSSFAGDSITVSESELKAQYDKDKEKYKVDTELRDIKYVSFKVTASAADRAALKATVDDAAAKMKEGGNLSDILRKAKSVYAYNALPMPKEIYANDIVKVIEGLGVGETSSPFETVADNSINVVKLIAKAQLPDSVEFRMIQVGGATIDAAKATADSIATAIKGGAPFDTLAVKYNGQIAQKQWFSNADYATTQAINADNKKLVSTILNANVNEVKAEVLTNAAFVIQVLNRRGISEKYDVAVVKSPITFSNETYNTAYNNFSRYVSESKTIADLEKNAAEFGYTVLEQNDVPNSIHGVAGITGTSDALKWAFDEAETGDVSPLYECGNNDNLLVVALAGVTPKGYAPFNKVKSVLNSEVLTEKNFAKASEKFNGVADINAAIANGIKVDTISRVTFSAPTFLSSTGSVETSLSGAVAAVAEGSTSPVVKGNMGAYMFQVLKKTQREGQTFNAATEEENLKQTGIRFVTSSFLSDLYSNANVVDNRYLFF